VSDFDDLYREIAMPAVFGLHGRTVTYVGDDEASAEITAVVGAEEADLLEIPGERVRHRHRVIEILTADVAAPRFPHKVTIAAEVWTVRELLGVQAGKARLRVTRPERIEGGGRRSMGR
jgi:hypothetical protein